MRAGRAGGTRRTLGVTAPLSHLAAWPQASVAPAGSVPGAPGRKREQLLRPELGRGRVSE